jgi:uncharacterized protein DUF6527
MKAPAREIRFRAEVEHRHDGDPLLTAAGDAVLVQRGRPRSLLLACPDGCGETVVVNLDPRAGRAWRMYRKGEAISLSPSVWREGGCESHFIVWRSRIMWCDRRFQADNQEPAYDVALEAEVLAAMDTVSFRPPHEIAEQLNEIPWDVARAARNLVASGFAEYGSGAQRDSVRKTAARQHPSGAPRKPDLLVRLWHFFFGDPK